MGLDVSANVATGERHGRQEIMALKCLLVALVWTLACGGGARSAGPAQGPAEAGPVVEKKKSRISRQDRLVQRDDIEVRGGALW